MAEQQQGGTNNWQVTWLPDGSILITTEDEMSAADVLEFALEDLPSESPSESPSLSPSASESPSESPSLSPSASESPSESPSLSPSASESPSESPSLSPSESPSLSPSASESPSESPSLSPSPSPGAWINDNVTWGRFSGVTETFKRSFGSAGHPVWTGTGTISGIGDAEQITLASGQYMESEMTNLGVYELSFETGKYDATEGTGLILKYKDGDSAANCDADTWHVYSAPFVSAGYTRLRIEAP